VNETKSSRSLVCVIIQGVEVKSGNFLSSKFGSNHCTGCIETIQQNKALDPSLFQYSERTIDSTETNDSSAKSP
jgi:hypothetical protein